MLRLEQVKARALNRLPLNDIYFPGSVNLDPKPETSENKELGLLLSYQDIALEVSISVMILTMK